VNIIHPYPGWCAVTVTPKGEVDRRGDCPKVAGKFIKIFNKYDYYLPNNISEIDQITRNSSL